MDNLILLGFIVGPLVVFYVIGRFTGGGNSFSGQGVDASSDSDGGGGE